MASLSLRCGLWVGADNQLIVKLLGPSSLAGLPGVGDQGPNGFLPWGL